MATCGDEVGPILFGDFFDTAPAIVTGTMAVTEGADAFAASGDVFVQGAMAVSETGADVAAMSGDVIVQGALAVTEQGADVAAASGQVIVSGTMAITESGSDIFSASSAPAKTKKRGGSWVSIPRESGKKPVEVVYEMRTKEEIARAAKPAKPVQKPVQVETPAPVVAKLKPVQRVDLTPIIDAATSAYSEAIGEYVQGAKEQLAHAAAVQAAKDARAKAIADELMRVAIKKARDEDEAAALVMIMAAIEE